MAKSTLSISRPCRILSTGQYLPTPVSSESIEEKHGLPKGWSMKYSGVNVRHQVTHETLAVMGSQAAQQALDAASLTLDDIDVFITGGSGFDQIIPCQAALTLSAMEGGSQAHCEAFHVNTTCLSFVTAFALAADKLQLPDVKRVLVVAAEVASKGIGPENWETLTLFGDGAAAVILEETNLPHCGLVAHMHKTYTEGTQAAQIPGGGIAKWIEDHAFDPALHHFHMDGRELLRLALKHLPAHMTEFFARAGTSWSEVDWTLPHQASKTGMGMIPKLAQVHPDRVINILEHTGNCIAASIPMALHELVSKGRLQPGQTAFLSGTSAGFAIGSLLYQHA